MTDKIPKTFNGAPIPHESSFAELAELIQADPPECGPAFIALGCRKDAESFFLLVETTKNKNTQRRLYAAAALRFHPMGRRALPALEPLLSDQDANVVKTVCDTMAALHLMSDKIAHLLQDPEPKVRHAAINALRKLKQPHLFSNILKLYERDPDKNVRKASAAACAALVREDNWKNLFLALRFDPIPQHRLWACEAAIKFGGEDAIDMLTDMVDDPDPTVQKKVKSALKELVEKSL